MGSLAESVREQPAMPRLEDGSVNLGELMRRIAEDVVNAIMDAEADQLYSGGANSRNGYRERNLVTCVSGITMRIPKLRSGSFFPENVVERYQCVDRAVVSAVAEMYATGTSARKVQRIAEKLGIARLSKDQVSAIAKDLDADIAELKGRDLADARTPCLRLDATYVKRGRDGRVASTAVVTVIGCDDGGGAACWDCRWWTPSRTTHDSSFCAASGDAASTADCRSTTTWPSAVSSRSSSAARTSCSATRRAAPRHLPACIRSRSRPRPTA